MALCASCRAQIEWFTTASGKRMPLDPSPAVNGNVIIVNDRAIVLKDGEETPPGTERFVSHFATCPGAAHHRRRANDRNREAL